MTLSSFCGCVGRFVSGLVGNSRRHVLSCRGSYIFRRPKTWLLSGYHRNPGHSDTRKIWCNHLKIWTRWHWLYRRGMGPNTANVKANSVDPEQSDLGLHYLPWPVCPNTCNHYGTNNIARVPLKKHCVILRLRWCWESWHQCFQSIVKVLKHPPRTTPPMVYAFDRSKAEVMV